MVIFQEVDRDAYMIESISLGKTASKSDKLLFIGGHLVLGGHIGGHFKKTTSQGHSPGRAPIVGKNTSKYVKCLLILEIFCVVAILKKGLRRYSQSRADIVETKLCQNTRIYFFISDVFFAWWPYWKPV